MLHLKLLILSTTLILCNLPKITPSSSSSEADKITSLPGQPSVNFQQYAGYVEVDAEKQRDLFYYFVEAESNPASKPLVLWLNGGPGCSSVGAGAFSENGPFRPSGDVLLKNDYSWNKEANMLYLESPVGVGFSYSTNKSFYDTLDDEKTARDNLVFLQNWLAKFPEYKDRDLFITGESYAGHYIPQLGNLILKSTLKSNLKGVAIGNPLLEFSTDFNSRGEFLWSHGLISDSTYGLLQTMCNYSQIRRQAQTGFLSPPCSLVNSQITSEIGRFVNYYDITLDVCLSSLSQQAYLLAKLDDVKINVCQEDETTKYLNRKDVQTSMHAQLLGVTQWGICSYVIRYNLDGLQVPITPLLGTLTNAGVPVFVFSGDQDSVIPLIATRMVVNNLAKDMGLKTTVPYRFWLQDKQVKLSRLA
uniref:Carboxypeptidase n=2 Tax=Opuntia streptacantha TaxID=393608 RepID=A0A7C9D069_OPUST